jgi:DNA-binding NarL/FixJ family response regulator
MISVFIIDDHPAVRQGYHMLIRREPDMHVCGESASGTDALDQISACRPDIVVLDVSLQGAVDGIDLLQQIRATYPDLAILVVSGHDETIFAERILQFGAQGYVMKGDALLFMETLRQVVAARLV